MQGEGIKQEEFKSSGERRARESSTQKNPPYEKKI
jgi:hypothetical protein